MSESFQNLARLGTLVTYRMQGGTVADVGLVVRFSRPVGSDEELRRPPQVRMRGYIYAPYIPLMITSNFLNSPSAQGRKEKKDKPIPGAVILWVKTGRESAPYPASWFKRLQSGGERLIVEVY